MMFRGICEVCVVSGDRKVENFNLFSLSAFAYVGYNIMLVCFQWLFNTLHSKFAIELMYFWFKTWYVLMGPVQFQHWGNFSQPCESLGVWMHHNSHCILYQPTSEARWGSRWNLKILLWNLVQREAGYILCSLFSRVEEMWNMTFMQPRTRGQCHK